MKKNKKLLILILIVVVGFIWINSFMPAKTSGAVSLWVTSWAEKIFGCFITDHLIRKLAHLTEYLFLGIICSVLFFESIKSKISTILFIGLFTAVCDETIQLFSYGRSSQVSDVWIDFIGFVIGLVSVYFFYLHSNKK